MHVNVLAQTITLAGPMLDAYGYETFPDGRTSDTDALAEAAGRLCYKSFNRPNPATRSNADYLANILAQQHESVLEHASVTFLVRGVSRALLTELTRHRHLSFSVVSQRYVDYAETAPVLPPAVVNADAETADLVSYAYVHSRAVYVALVAKLAEQGLSRKAAREAARCVLPNAAPVDMIVTGNLRAWRDVLRKRWHVAADAEIRLFAGLVLDHLANLAPNSVQDIPALPYGTETDNAG